MAIDKNGITAARAFANKYANNNARDNIYNALFNAYLKGFAAAKELFMEKN